MSVTPMKRRRIPRNVLSLEVSLTFSPLATTGPCAGIASLAEDVGGRLVSSMDVLAETISGVVDAPVSVFAAETVTGVVVSSECTFSFVFFLDSKPMMEVEEGGLLVGEEGVAAGAAGELV